MHEQQLLQSGIPEVCTSCPDILQRMAHVTGVTDVPVVVTKGTGLYGVPNALNVNGRREGFSGSCWVC